MTIKTKDQLSSMLWGLDGAPLVRVAAKSGIGTTTFRFGVDGGPFVAAEGGAAPPPDPEPGQSTGYIMVVIAS